MFLEKEGGHSFVSLPMLQAVRDKMSPEAVEAMEFIIMMLQYLFPSSGWLAEESCVYSIHIGDLIRGIPPGLSDEETADRLKVVIIGDMINVTGVFSAGNLPL